jgi:hypothetical protein
MMSMVIQKRRTELAPFLLDLLDFMEEKIREAVTDEASQAGAVSEAAGAVPLLRDRLREDETKQAQFMLVFDAQLSEAHAAQWWAEFARMDRAAFEKQAADLVRPHGVLAALRTVAAASPGTS